MKLTQYLVAIATLALTSLALVAPTAMADNKFPHTPIDNGREVSTEDIILPTTVGGTLIFKSCGKCKFGSLQVTSDSKFFVNSAQVSLADLNALVRKSGPLFTMVFQKPNAPYLTRVVVYAKPQTTSQEPLKNR